MWEMFAGIQSRFQFLCEISRGGNLNLPHLAAGVGGIFGFSAISATSDFLRLPELRMSCDFRQIRQLRSDRIGSDRIRPAVGEPRKKRKKQGTSEKARIPRLREKERWEKIPIALGWRIGYLRDMGGKATHHTTPTDTNMELLLAPVFLLGFPMLCIYGL